jgi:hypothetical protein
MKDGVSGAPCPNGLPYAQLINSLCLARDFFPCLVGAIKMNETGLGQGPATEHDISADGGHGIMQLTSSFPSDWADPRANIAYAVDHFLLPNYQVLVAPPYSFQGDDLVRAVAAAYNEGLGTAEEDHDRYSNVDYGTTNDYGARALIHYQNLVAGTVA